ncbi:DUF1343 domain-containing protein [soil metagenome]
MQLKTQIQFGIDHLLSDDLPGGKLNRLKQLRIGLVTNDAATTARFPAPLMPSRLALQQMGVNLVALFSPEHGLAANAAEGVSVDNQRDPLTGLPVYSLYGATHRPTAEQLSMLDILLFDIPDIGARFYTYIWTLSHVLEACATQQLPLWILDRPNPLSGNLAHVEGPMLNEQQLSSFVGRWSMPVRHSLTIAELANLWNHERRLKADLTVIPVQNWQRSDSWPATLLPFIPSSPNMPTYETALLYLGLCLFEGTNLSEGRGTPTPFRVIGAPWLDAVALTAAFNALALPGILARAVHFTPYADKYRDQACQGVMLHLLDAELARPVAAGMHLLTLIRQAHPQDFEWLPAPEPIYPQHFDRLIGQLEIREQLDTIRQEDQQGHKMAIAVWTTAAGWANRSAPFLLYP